MFELPLRKGLKRKYHRICISKSEELERKARFAAFYAANAPGTEKQKPCSVCPVEKGF
jgi:hypothetical protein